MCQLAVLVLHAVCRAGRSDSCCLSLDHTHTCARSDVLNACTLHAELHIQVVFTIHNMNYGQKKIAEAAAFCQSFTTVSPTYAFEVGSHPAIAGVDLGGWCVVGVVSVWRSWYYLLLLTDPAAHQPCCSTLRSTHHHQCTHTHTNARTPMRSQCAQVPGHSQRHRRRHLVARGQPLPADVLQRGQRGGGQAAVSLNV